MNTHHWVDGLEGLARLAGNELAVDEQLQVRSMSASAICSGHTLSHHARAACKCAHPSLDVLEDLVLAPRLLAASMQ